MKTRLDRRVVEIDTLAEFDDAAAAVGTSMDGWRVRRLDLTSRSGVLLRRDPTGALFLGCDLAGDALVHVQAGGALVFPEVPGIPVNPYRSELYSAAELYGELAEHGYQATLDARVYAWSQGAEPGSTSDVVAKTIHDAGIDAALDAALAGAGRRVVGVMGGHDVARGTDAFRQATLLGSTLTGGGMLVATGGGPGAMEAANLGAYLAGRPGSDVDAALAALAAVPSFRPSVGNWADAALDVRQRWPGGNGGIGVPTWFYGHEPPNVFAAGIAKFFQNAVREATLVKRCTGGVVFLPGAAGTIQEVFQDACENYYAAPEQVAPMVLVGVQHWTAVLPAWPLLEALAAGTRFAEMIALVDDVEEAAAFVESASSAT